MMQGQLFVNERSVEDLVKGFCEGQLVSKRLSKHLPYTVIEGLGF